MSDDILSWALRRTFTSGLLADHLEVLWHAGEPLVVGQNFYRNATQLIERLNTTPTKTRQCIQTNGILIDPEWCDVFRSANIRIGVSIDGPQDIHDSHRKTRSGKGTFHRAMKGVECLRRHRVDFSILAVLTKESLVDSERVLDFFETEGMQNVGFNLEEFGSNRERWSFTSRGETETLFKAFVAEAYKRHREGRLRIREIRQISERLENGGLSPKLQVIPLRVVTVGVDGCFSTFCPELHQIKYADGSIHCFGNVKENELIDIFGNLEFLRIHEKMMAGVQKCAASCERFSICGSAQPCNKYFANGSFDSTETLFCRTRIKAVADVIERSR